MTTAARHPAGAPRPAARDPGTAAFAAAQAVADAVLYEGYLLYPYRRSSPKNRVRWQFGVLAPPAWIEAQQIPDPGVAGAAESWFQQADCLLEAPADAMLRLRLRFLHLQRKQCFTLNAAGGRVAAEELCDGTTTHVSFDGALPREVDVELALGKLLSAERLLPVDVPASQSIEPVREPSGRAVGEVQLTSWPVTGRIRVKAQRAQAPFALLRLTIRIENTVEIEEPDQPRTEVMRHCMIATHLLVSTGAGAFLSLTDPPAWAAAAASDCVNRHVFPVLAGAEGRDDVVLCSPIILYDHPKVAPESPGDLHDAVEIDEILSLRALTMTDAEKAEARATDPRAAEIVDRVDAMPPEMMAKLHGAIRDLHPLPDTVFVAGQRVGAGSSVRLHPRRRGTDAHDMFLAGRTARVHAVLHDVDGSVYLAVNLDDDPGADLLEAYGRFFHFSPDEIEPIGSAP